MKIHANARTCPNSRRLLVKRIEEEGWSLMVAAEAAGISERTARQVAGSLAGGGRGGAGRSQLRTEAAPDAAGGRSPGGDRGAAAVADDSGGDRRGSRHGALDGLAVAGADRARQAQPLAPPEPPNRYERKRPGELIHVDVKKLGRISVRGAGHRVTGHRRASSRPGPGASARPAGSSSTSASTTPPASPTSRCLPTRRARPPPASCGARSSWFQAMGVRVERVLVRQRRLLPLRAPCRGLPRARHPPPLHPPLPAPHQRQGRALHPDAHQPLGLRSDLWLLGRANRGASRLARPLQLQQTTWLPRPQGARSSARRAGTTS